MIRSELDHRRAMPGIEVAQRERDADLVVEVAAGGGDRTRGPEDRGGHFLDRRLAVAPGDPDQEQIAEAVPPRRGEVAECPHRIAREDERHRIARYTFDQERRRAAPPRVADEVVTIESRPAHGNEQRAPGGGTRVGADPVKHDVPPGRPETERRGRFAEVHPDHRHASNARRAAAVSLNGSLAPLHSWLSSCPLPAISTTSAARAPVIAR